MAHFAKVENGKVTNIIVVDNNDCGGGEFPSSETLGQKFIKALGFDGEWVQTSYSSSFRGNFAGIGMNWDGSVFFADQPYPSWTLSAEGQWEPPVPRPQGSDMYVWDEPSQRWRLAS